MNSVLLIQGVLSMVPAALQAYAEIKGTLDANSQADIDALIAQIRPLALAAEQQAIAELTAAAGA